jgi:hypothetical protein
VSPEDTDEHLADQQPRCEFGKTLIGRGECPRVGEVWLAGSLLCLPHAELLRLSKREDSLLAEVFELDKWLEKAKPDLLTAKLFEMNQGLDSTDGQPDELRVLRVEHQRNELVEQLRFNRTRIDFIHAELLEDQYGPS